ncbi:uroporphyrinogen-III synthase [Deinococcus lacus]|uniref:Uroporphyrinogen-III synthase n=1 Tax=Deinococcus lacus TaxID=392561 RepID=A0ABW1YC06_9DEIO
MRAGVSDTVVVTQTGAGGARCAARLRSEGFSAVHLPLTGFGPPDDPQPWEQAQASLMAGAYRWTVLTSPQAARAFVQQVPAQLAGPCAAVGAGTAQVLQAAGVEVQFVPSQADAQHLAAELPCEPGDRVLHPRSAEAAPTLSRSLAARGCTVDSVALYRPCPLALPPSNGRNFAWQQRSLWRLDRRRGLWQPAWGPPLPSNR